ncbi:serine hydrolase domain-containing protein [Anaeromicropila herbilytica]|uniref:Penicillin-binding protein n=1 Tax=Anaeromicropila herbilytica TaxID=2785025 RepID=A0A7R7EJP7_9FIRM|nr:serine hydrolase domain-containing protein [Anaeromicropila herbilytica]BCN30042.1 penicillin-binding protein [Anaeromicropila herbilytica]
MRTIFENLCMEYAQNKKFSGTCMVKSEHEIIFSGSYGYANIAFGIPNVIDTKFDTASITKTFTAAAIMQLIEKGVLNLTDKIVNIIDLKDTKIPENVTIEHLLNHTSGIADDADEEAGEEYSALFINTPNYSFRECKDFLKNFAYKDPYFKAGTNVRYSNCAFILLGLAIEKLTGVSYRTYVTENIFKVCEMTNTRFSSMDEINENTAEGYTSVFDENDNWIGFKKNIYCYPPIGTADSGAYTTVEDLDKFMRGIKDGKLFAEKYSQMLLTPHCDIIKPSSWREAPDTTIRNGYAFEFIEIEKETFCIYKDGLNNGVATMFSYYPKADITVSILANQDCNIWELHRQMQTEIYHRYYK